MLRFLRRVFVILVLLIVVFVIFRIVNPTGTAKFVEKVKTVPQTISGWFHRKADDTKNVVIDGIDTVLTGDITVSKGKKKDKDKKNDKNVVDSTDNKQTIGDEDIYSGGGDSISDFVWLEKLNRETENMLGLNSGKNNVVVNTGCETDQCKKIEQDLKNLAKEVDNLKTSISGLNEKIDSNSGIVFVELKNEEINTNSGNNTQSNTTQNNTPTTSQTTTKTTTTTTTKKRTNCCDANCVLSQSECAEANMIGNLFE